MTKRRAYAPRLRTYTQPAQLLLLEQSLQPNPQPALRTGLMAPAWRLLHVSRRILDSPKDRGLPAPWTLSACVCLLRFYSSLVGHPRRSFDDCGRRPPPSDETFDVCGRRPPPQAAAVRSVSEENIKFAAERRGRGSAPRFGSEQKREFSPRPQPALF